MPIDRIESDNKKQLLEVEKTVVSNKKQLLESKIDNLRVRKQSKKKILQLYEQFGDKLAFSRADIMYMAGITSSPAGDLINKMKKGNLIESVTGEGKGKYRFKS